MAEDTVNLEFQTRHALVLAFVVGLLAGGFIMAAVTGVNGVTLNDTGQNGQPSAPDDTGDAPSPSESPVENTISMDNIDLEGNPSMGEADAPVTMVVYEDFECPFCQRFEQNAMKDIKRNYVDSGQVRVVWKDFPLDQIHPWATPAAVAMECVYRQDESAFWTVKNKVFANQDTISQGNAQSQIKDWASQEGVSTDAVQSCIEGGDASQAVSADKSEGRTVGVTGTPTAFINGKMIVGAQPYSAFKQVIDSELNS